MQYAADKFERETPRQWRNLSFTCADQGKAHPGAIEAIGWVFLAFCAGCLFVGFLGM